MSSGVSENVSPSASFNGPVRAPTLNPGGQFQYIDWYAGAVASGILCVLRKARGTEESPVDVSPNDVTGGLQSQALSTIGGTQAFRSVGNFRFRLVSVGASGLNGKWELVVQNNGAALIGATIDFDGTNEFYAPPAAQKRISALVDATTPGQTVSLPLTSGTVFNLLCNTTNFNLSVSGPSNVIFDFDLYVYNNTGNVSEVTYSPTQLGAPDNTVPLPPSTVHFLMRWINGRVIVISRTVLPGDCRQI